MLHTRQDDLNPEIRFEIPTDVTQRERRYPHLKDRDRHTAERIARAQGHRHVTVMLRDRGMSW